MMTAPTTTGRAARPRRGRGSRPHPRMTSRWIQHRVRWVGPRPARPERLSAAFVRNAPVGRHCDGNGLYLVVQPTGARSWIQRIAIRGRRHDIGLGSVRLVPLAEAREKAVVNRKLARDGGDPRSPARAASRCRTRRSTPSSRSTASPPCRTASARRSGTGRPRRRTIRGRSSRRRWRTWSRTRSRRPTRGRTCSSAGGG